MSSLRSQKRRVFARTCQECSHIQRDKDPLHRPTPAYNNRRCRRCKSAALDYGHSGFTLATDGKTIVEEKDRF